AVRCVQPSAVRRVICGGAGVVPAGASAGDPDVFRLGSLLALGDVELDLLPFLQAAAAATGDRADMHEHVRAALDRDEAVAFVTVQPLPSAVRHLDLLVVHAAPGHGRAPRSPPALASLSRNARGVETVWLANCPAGGPFPARPASTAGANTRAGGACPAPGPGTRTRMLTGPSRVLPVPEGDHGRGAMVVVMLRGSQRLACPRGRCDGQPARGRDGSGWPCPRAGPGAGAARGPGTAGRGSGGTGAAGPRSPGRPPPTRIQQRGQQS